MTHHNTPFNKNQRLRVCTITQIIDETPTIKSFIFEDDMTATGGQFVMVWVPGVDEVPMSVSYTGELKGITVAHVGPATARLHELNAGVKLGIRGPYGHGFNIDSSRRILAVAGGCGSAPIGPVLETVAGSNKHLLFVLGARTANELLFKKRAHDLGFELDISTDDGSEGHHGIVTERVSQLVHDNNFDLIIACGPEPMLAKLVTLARENQIQLQASLERYMKCGVGICDACAIDGYQVCQDGPVFDNELLAKLTELGKTRRDPCGRLIDV